MNNNEKQHTLLKAVVYDDFKWMIFKLSTKSSPGIDLVYLGLSPSLVQVSVLAQVQV